MVRKWVWIVGCLLWAAAAHAQTGPTVGMAQSRLVLYRPAGAALEGVSALQVQGQHHTALVAGAYSDMCFAVGPVRLTVRQLPGAAVDVGLNLALAGGRSQYVRLDAQGGQPVLQLVDEAQAQRELQGLRAQTHTMSRVGVSCQAEASPVAMRGVRREALPAEFAWTAGAALSEAGQRALQALVAGLRRDYKQVERLRVVAHVDAPVQAAEAAQRAEQVRQVLQAQGERDWPIQTEVLALYQSPLADCASVPPQQMAQACPLGPRLVVLEVLGVRR